MGWGRPPPKTALDFTFEDMVVFHKKLQNLFFSILLLHFFKSILFYVEKIVI